MGLSTFTGGSGRIQGATGHGSLDGYSDFKSSTFIIDLTGTPAVPEG